MASAGGTPQAAAPPSPARPAQSKGSGLGAAVPKKGEAKVNFAWGLVCDVAEFGSPRPGKETRGPPSRHLAAEGPGGRAGLAEGAAADRVTCPSASETRPYRKPPAWSSFLGPFYLLLSQGWEGNNQEMTAAPLCRKLRLRSEETRLGTHSKVLAAGLQGTLPHLPS